ncbi:ethylbenzene dehydrogenase-related protein [Haloarchaeobius amylolyticus]|uniref:ethylbenzene dehydrogenase-related protein n=1 Tax=Haloarchaeobius amylolyticus TaxID=1198296 RepID=UPI002271E358|nr:ethylbenzene dehydrogenase-related protein [Haloarchaeobius amylolyticus]
MTDDRGTDTETARTIAVTLALTALVVASALLVPMLASARPAHQIPVHEPTGEANPASPDAAAWDRAPPVDVPMTSAPSGLPNAEKTSVEEVKVQSIRTEERFYVRLSWHDGTADRNASSPRTFADALAVQLPVNHSARPPIAMGSTRNPVNVWYWSPTAGSEELLAGGAGTTTEFGQSAVNVTTSYDDGRWTVVMARDLQATGQNRTAVPADRDMDVAFAVWNGSQMERSGRKSVSEWYHFALGPGPQGPPYETLLWSIAGVAIVGVAVATVTAMRRT